MTHQAYTVRVDKALELPLQTLDMTIKSVKYNTDKGLRVLERSMMMELDSSPNIAFYGNL